VADVPSGLGITPPQEEEENKKEEKKKAEWVCYWSLLSCLW
jgi:hypothetical protein